MSFHVRVWIHSEQLKECKLTQEKMDTSIYMKMEDAKNGLYPVAVVVDNDDDDDDDDDLRILPKNYKTEGKNWLRKTWMPKYN